MQHSLTHSQVESQQQDQMEPVPPFISSLSVEELEIESNALENEHGLQDLTQNSFSYISSFLAAHSVPKLAKLYAALYHEKYKASIEGCIISQDLHLMQVIFWEQLWHLKADPLAFLDNDEHPEPGNWFIALCLHFFCLLNNSPKHHVVTLDAHNYISGEVPIPGVTLYNWCRLGQASLDRMAASIHQVECCFVAWIFPEPLDFQKQHIEVEFLWLLIDHIGPEILVVKAIGQAAEGLSFQLLGWKYTNFPGEGARQDSEQELFQWISISLERCIKSHNHGIIARNADKVL
ncbi:hypothetical protein GYMLUDRAFT_244534 [Collybiopsis luxurians FD-317 M1]|uniref:Uncharacterized protein n=1 Tax=Collybiopsis luxurians FD-317 M1 TaxID=944289 RepID=A0A0D0CC63_9AGAR|nr:hypothetical protein GYMLUDRAFT_244534 [Collybiopsis luxurians FD-317 M1]